MGAQSRRKGADGEREVVALARTYGLPADRTWHLAQSPDAGERRSDVRIAGQPYQVKRSRSGWKALYDGLADVQGMFVRSDRGCWLVVLQAQDYLRLLKALGRPAK